jgi:ribosomal protein S18 acetylase RimI-like enzyme
MSQNVSITYRPYLKKDALQVRSLYIDAFDFRRFSKNNQVLSSLADIYLRFVMSQSTYGQVAVFDGKIIGVLFGRADEEPYISHHWLQKLVLGWLFIKVGFLTFFKLNNIFEALKIDQSYKALKAMVPKSFEGEITTLLVSNQYRGYGVGKRLYYDVVDYFKTHHVKRFFLFTDSALSYGFYDKQGLKREATKLITLNTKPKPQNLEVYFYSGVIHSLESSILED